MTPQVRVELCASSCLCLLATLGLHGVNVFAAKIADGTPRPNAPSGEFRFVRWPCTTHRRLRVSSCPTRARPGFSTRSRSRRTMARMPSDGSRRCWCTSATTPFCSEASPVSADVDLTIQSAVLATSSRQDRAGHLSSPSSVSRPAGRSICAGGSPCSTWRTRVRLPRKARRITRIRGLNDNRVDFARLRRGPAVCRRRCGHGGALYGCAEAARAVGCARGICHGDAPRRGRPRRVLPHALRPCG